MTESSSTPRASPHVYNHHDTLPWPSYLLSFVIKKHHGTEGLNETLRITQLIRGRTKTGAQVRLSVIIHILPPDRQEVLLVKPDHEMSFRVPGFHPLLGVERRFGLTMECLSSCLPLRSLIPARCYITSLHFTSLVGYGDAYHSHCGVWEDKVTIKCSAHSRCSTNGWPGHQMP